jgi:hypothetical protein
MLSKQIYLLYCAQSLGDPYRNYCHYTVFRINATKETDSECVLENTAVVSPRDGVCQSS